MDLKDLKKRLSMPKRKRASGLLLFIMLSKLSGYIISFLILDWPVRRKSDPVASENHSIDTAITPLKQDNEPRRLSQLTSQEAIKEAITECDLLGREEFLQKYGYKPSRLYPLIYKGQIYDSKAIAGVAIGKQYGTPLKAEEFSGGVSTVVRVLTKLGFPLGENVQPLQYLSVRNHLSSQGPSRPIRWSATGGNMDATRICSDFPIFGRQWEKVRL